MSIQVLVNKINNLLSQIKWCLCNRHEILPFKYCQKQFDMQQKIMMRKNPTAIILKSTTLGQVLRLVEILTIIQNLLLNNKFITKRNLYYQLVKYYEYYSLIDDDLEILCDTLKVQRSYLNIIVSSKLQLFWFNKLEENKQKEIRIQLGYKKFIQEEKFKQNKQQNNSPTLDTRQDTQNPSKLFIQKQCLPLIPHQIFKIPNCPKLQVNILYPIELKKEEGRKINFLILQKQSIFEILTESLIFKKTHKNQNWFLVNSKGYPDRTALRFVNEILNYSKTEDIQIYYIGDLDVYGIDIFFNYAIGNQNLEGLWTKIRWLSGLDQLVEIQDKKHPGLKIKHLTECRKQNVQQKRKSQKILTRPYFKFQDFKSSQFQEKQIDHKDEMLMKDLAFIQKAKKWKKVLENLIHKGIQCEVESYFKHFMYPFDLIELMIENELYCC